jgi:hypothetical protein
VHGEKNIGMDVLRRLDDIEVVQISDSGHFMLLERPAETYAAIVARL